MQTPAVQTSPVVHAHPSLQGFVFGAFTQPSSVSQLSSVQGFASSQVRGTPGWHPSTLSQNSDPLQAFASSHTSGVPTHAPATHASPVVQTVPSLHGFVSSGTLKQPAAESHESS